MKKDVFAVVDIETNGLELDDEIHEIAVRIVNKKGILTNLNFHSLVKNTKPLSDFSKKVSGFNEEELKEAPPIEEVINNLLAWRKEHFDKPLTPIGHNYSSFDSIRLKIFAKGRYDDVFNHRIIDTKIISKTLIECGLIKPTSTSLLKLCRHFGLVYNDSTFHRAYADTFFTNLLYRKLLKIIKPNILTRIVRVFNPTYAGV